MPTLLAIMYYTEVSTGEGPQLRVALRPVRRNECARKVNVFSVRLPGRGVCR